MSAHFWREILVQAPGPYAEPSKQKEYHRTLFLSRYQSDPYFREGRGATKKAVILEGRA